MPPKTKGTTNKKLTTKPISDPFLSDLSVNKPSTTLDSRQIHRTANPSPKKSRSTRGVLNDSNGSLAAMEVEEIRIILEDFDVDGALHQPFPFLKLARDGLTPIIPQRTTSFVYCAKTLLRGLKRPSDIGIRA